MANVKDFVSVKKLNNTKDFQALEIGAGCVYTDDNGTNFRYNDEKICYLEYVEFAPNKVRGNHYHLERVENLCVLKGILSGTFFFPKSPDVRYEIDLVPGDLVTVLPGCAHCFVSDDIAVALVFAQQKFKSTDVYKL